ncbi:MAG TPA: uroporphyrinogen decarboxylase family protein [Anaerolineales bacterium]|nr:uroporphyrinogen decarboxylase family protein [Anaerolineales bacterium]
MPDLLLDHPAPDFDELVRVLKGEQAPRRVHLVEVGIDPEVLQTIQESCLGEPWALPRGVHVLERPDERYYRQLVNLYYRLGYDFVPIWPFWVNNPPGRIRRATDTSDQPYSTRNWVDESAALIKSRADYESFPWERIYAAPETFEMVARCLPDGMKMTVIANLFENVFENLLGYEGLCYLMHDDPQLVEHVFNGWGQVVYDHYASVIGLEAVGGIFHVDDMGFNTGTMISPAELHRLLFPWLAKYATLAHQQNKPFFLHSCGNLYKKSPSVMDELIGPVGIDGFHSFQDVILPVTEAKVRYGHRVALLGGVDMDKLSTLPETELQVYLREILKICMPGGRFAFGSGNTIANFVPLQNYVALLKEARQWKE